MAQLDLAGSLLGDSKKESRSSLGTRREIVGKKTGGLAARLPEVAGVCGTGVAPLLRKNMLATLKCHKRLREVVA
ncbi:hypothetical protein GW17_00054480 [Ensete ventricosum]|nr:hypothetical protein GW17_00054480 [Ensete ventricosum]